MLRRAAILAGAALLVALSAPIAPAFAAPTAARCEQAWFEYQYAEIAPGFPTTMSPSTRDKTMKACAARKLLPSNKRKGVLTQRALGIAAQILERQIWRVSTESGLAPCLAISEVLKPVGPYGKPLGPGDDVMGYAPDSYLPILKYNWWSGPFRLKFAVGCDGAPWSNLWFYTDPYPPNPNTPGRFPAPADLMKDPWNRTPVEGRMSTCITWGPGLDNDQSGGRGRIFSFDWSPENLPQDVRSCYPRAMGEDGLGKYPSTPVPNLS